MMRILSLSAGGKMTFYTSTHCPGCGASLCEVGEWSLVEQGYECSVCDETWLTVVDQ